MSQVNWDTIGTVLVVWQCAGLVIGQLWTSRDDQPFWWMAIGAIVFGPIGWILLLFIGTLLLFGWFEKKLIGPNKGNACLSPTSQNSKPS